MDYLLAIIDATEAMLTSLGPLGKRLLQGLGIDWPEGRRGEVPVLRSYRREKLVEALKSLLLDQVDEVDVPFVRLCARSGTWRPARKRTFRIRPKFDVNGSLCRSQKQPYAHFDQQNRRATCARRLSVTAGWAEGQQFRNQLSLKPYSGTPSSAS